MSFNRLIYDKCSYKQSLQESMKPGKYQLYPENIIISKIAELILV